MHNPLGQDTAYPTSFDPALLFAIPRSQGRAQLSGSHCGVRHGVDIWRAWEVSWLNPNGLPRMGVLQLSIAADSQNLVESKSLKLYLNSLAFATFETREAMLAQVRHNVAKTVQGHVEVAIFAPDAAIGARLPGTCIDAEAITPPDFTQVNPTLLQPDSKDWSTPLFSHLFRSLCPVTSQPDWATIWVDCQGKGPKPAQLLAYLLSYRAHQGFHEQCVERIFQDIQTRCQPDALTVIGYFTRRGGIDINPVRSSAPCETPIARIARQ